MKNLFLIVSVAIALLLAGCSESRVVYKGKEMPVSEAQERIADELEVENPDRDLEVQIYEESDD